MKLLDCALLCVCAVIKSNMVVENKKKYCAINYFIAALFSWFPLKTAIFCHASCKLNFLDFDSLKKERKILFCLYMVLSLSS